MLLFIIGLVHGLSNSGGTLLSILVLKIYKNSKNITRYNLTFFYFFLAIMQYLIFIIIFQKLISIDLILILLFPSAQKIILVAPSIDEHRLNVR